MFQGRGYKLATELFAYHVILKMSCLREARDLKRVRVLEMI